MCRNASLSDPRGYSLCFSCLLCSGGSPNICWSKSCFYTLISVLFTIQQFFDLSDSVFCLLFNSSIKFSIRPHFNKASFHFDHVSSFPAWSLCVGGGGREDIGLEPISREIGWCYGLTSVHVANSTVSSTKRLPQFVTRYTSYMWLG